MPSLDEIAGVALVVAGVALHRPVEAGADDNPRRLMHDPRSPGRVAPP
jgi:hypothetical protein